MQEHWEPILKLLLTAAALAFAFDQASKQAVFFGLDLVNRRAIDVFPPFLNFRLGWNRGVNFGLFAGEAEAMRWLLIALSLAIVTWLFLWARRQPGAVARLCAGLVIGGALGNVADRLRFGAVADFLNVSCCGINNPYAFNTADIFIFGGIFGLVLFANKPENRP